MEAWQEFFRIISQQLGELFRSIAECGVGGLIHVQQLASVAIEDEQTVMTGIGQVEHQLQAFTAVAQALLERAGPPLLADVDPTQVDDGVHPAQRVRVELAQAASEQRNALSRLFALLGRIDAPYTVLEGKAENLPSVPSLADLQPLISSSPGVVLARIEVDRRKALTDLEQSKRVPDVTVSVGMQRSNETQRNVLLFGVSVPLPVFDRNQGNLLEALKLEDKARDELQAATVRLHSEVAQARERLSTITAEVQSLQQDVLPGAKSAYDAATIGFENGKFNFLEVLDAQRTYFTAKSQYLKALGEAHRAAADIDRLLGASMVPGLIATQH